MKMMILSASIVSLHFLLSSSHSLSHLCSEFSKGSSTPFVPLCTMANLFWCLPPACSPTYQGLRIGFCSYANTNEHVLLGWLLQSHWPDFSTYSVFCKHQEEFGKWTVFYLHSFHMYVFTLEPYFKPVWLHTFVLCVCDVSSSPSLQHTVEAQHMNADVYRMELIFSSKGLVGICISDMVWYRVYRKHTPIKPFPPEGLWSLCWLEE